PAASTASWTRTRSSSLVHRRHVLSQRCERVGEHRALQNAHVFGELLRRCEHHLDRLLRRRRDAARDPRAEAADVELVRRDAAEALVVVHADEPLQLNVETGLLAHLAQRVGRWRRADLRVPTWQCPALVVRAPYEDDAPLVVELLGTFLGDRLPERLRLAVVRGIGLFTIVLGVRFAIDTAHLLYLLGSILLGGMVGTLLALDLHLDRLGAALQRRFTRPGRTSTVSEAFVTA